MEAHRYEFVIDGALSERACAAFPQLRATVAEHPELTHLVGPVSGRAALRTILGLMDDMCLKLHGLRQLPD
ncbi:hypothetical protein [Nocardia mikamii]|uniref:hypothetical protein n=1 Tax=Nocardia mikamii TaxID=508464 RepID=UPI0007A517F8|nr:hypothetical protein [Nocardia mikamii]